MTYITVSEQCENSSNIFYLQREIAELFIKSDRNISCVVQEGVTRLKISVGDEYYKVIKEEICDKVSEIIVINYKYNFLKENVNVCGLSPIEKELLITCLIAADLDDDKKYVFDRITGDNVISVDGIFNFRLKPLKRKWEEVVTFIPTCFVNSQLKEFVTYLIDNKNKKTYIDNGKVYDCHYKRLNRCELMKGTDEVTITREVLLSNCGTVSLAGSIPKEDEFYLNEFFSDKLTFCDGYFC